MTARQIIETRLGRLLGPVATMPRDLRRALYLLALHRLLKSRLGAGYVPAEQLGGALFFFLRGLDGESGGLHELAPSLALLDALDAMLAEAGEENPEYL